MPERSVFGSNRQIVFTNHSGEGSEKKGHDMKIPEDLSRPSALSPAISGAFFPPSIPQSFEPRLPSTWPPVTTPPEASFVDTLERLFKEGMLAELENVCSDILARGKGGLQGRGHVIGIAMMSALDSLSQFAYPTERQHVRIPQFVEKFFPNEFYAIREELNTGYRNGLIHEWFMRFVAFLPGSEPISIQANGSPVLGLLTFKSGLTHSVDRFLEALRAHQELRNAAAQRYHTLQANTRS